MRGRGGGHVKIRKASRFESRPGRQPLSILISCCRWLTPESRELAWSFEVVASLSGSPFRAGFHSAPQVALPRCFPPEFRCTIQAAFSFGGTSCYECDYWESRYSL